jgi:hypothetical protein
LLQLVKSARITVPAGGIVQETVIFSGTIIGEGQRVECKVRATKTLLDEEPSARPVFSGYTVMESDATDKLPDGDYDLLANGERIRFRRNDGRFLTRL